VADEAVLKTVHGKNPKSPPVKKVVFL
jgi:hypothetical protein